MTVKIVPDMTYNVFSGTLNLAQSINQSINQCTADGVEMTPHDIFKYFSYQVLAIIKMLILCSLWLTLANFR